MTATKNSHDWHCETHATYGWRGEECRKCPEAPSEIESLRKQNIELLAAIEQMREGINEFLVANDPSEFGCACDLDVGYLCGPCFADKQQNSLRKASATTADRCEFYTIPVYLHPDPRVKELEAQLSKGKTGRELELEQYVEKCTMKIAKLRTAIDRVLTNAYGAWVLVELASVLDATKEEPCNTPKPT